LQPRQITININGKIRRHQSTKISAIIGLGYLTLDLSFL
jgi:hypothetical protein